MRNLAIILLLVPLTFLSAQKIGKIAPEKTPEKFPDHSWGIDLMFGEGGFGLGSFYRKSVSSGLTGFVDISFSESKDDKEVEYVTYYGDTYSPYKKNRVFLIPLTFGVQYRLFKSLISDNLRPFIAVGAGPSLAVTTPYEMEFFNSFKKAHAHYAVGGYVGFGAYFGLSKSNLVGLNMRYYYSHLFDEGVENMPGRFRKNIGSFFISIHIGMMY